MFFSVIVPVGNKAPHLERSINSVLAQTFSEFELILVDDATTDGSGQKLKEFKDPRIRVLKRDVPGPGGYAARNLGVNEAHSKWIAFLDADDEWNPDYLMKMHNAILENPDVYVFSCGYYYSDTKYKRPNRYYELNNKLGDHMFDFSKFLLNKPMWTGTVVIDRQIILQAGGFPEGRTELGGDEFLWLNIMDIVRKGFWLNFLGATYHRNSVNMVTRTITAELPSMILFPLIKALISKEPNKILVRDLKRYWNFKAWFFFKDISRRRVLSFNDLTYYFWEVNTLNVKIFVPIAYSFKNLFSKRLTFPK